MLGLPIALLALCIGPVAVSATTPPPPRDLQLDGRVPRVTPLHKAKRFHPAPAVGVGGISVNLASVATTSLQKRAAKGSIIALDEERHTFAIPVGLGDPGIAYPLQVDTGSSDLILASTACGDRCPGKTDSNPYYNTASHSNSFVSVDNNQTGWSARFGDGSVASGFVARERVSIATVVLEGQVFGLINATNLTLPDQKISGVLGLGFPRLSSIARALLHEGNETAVGVPAVGVPAAASLSASGTATQSGSQSLQRRQETSSSPSSPSSSSSSSSSATLPPVAPAAQSSSPLSSPSSSPSYLPPVLESLFSQPNVPYPVFGLALCPPNDTSPAAPAAAKSRYDIAAGSLTLGGVSEQYVSSDANSGRTVNDIEWWPVVPFGPRVNASGSGSASSSAPTSSIPTTAAQLDDEAYLYWALELTNVGLNGTGVGLNSSYSSMGIPSIAVIDAGSNGIYGPQQDVEKIFRNVTYARQVSTGQWAVPCDAKVRLGFTFGGRYIDIQPRDWIHSAVAGTTMCLAWPMAAPSSGDGVDWQLGTPFLKNAYTVFSYGINGVQAPQIGFLPLTDRPTTNSTTTPTIIPAAPTTTLNTVLPNHLIPGPDYSTPSYLFSGRLPTGAPQSIGLANASAFAVSAVPVVSLPQSAPSASGTTNVPDVPGWPVNSTEHANSGARGVGVSGAAVGAGVCAGLLAVLV